MDVTVKMDAAVKHAANLWVEQTETDRAVLREVQRGTVEVCAEFLEEAGDANAAAGLRSLLLAPARGLRLDLGCGQQKKPGFTGVDVWEGADIVHDLRKPFPWADATVAEVWCNQVVEHLEPDERVQFVNELYRVMAVGARATIIVPDWKSRRSIQDQTHKFPPLCDRSFSYVSASARREMKVDHYGGWTCDFDYQWRYLDNGDLCVTLVKTRRA